MSNPGNERYVIVVGIDFDDTSEQALRDAFRLAKVSRETEIHAVHAIAAKPASVKATNEMLEEYPRKVRAFITEKAATMADASGLAVYAHSRVGAAAEVLDQVAADVNADVLIVGTHGRQGLKKLALGSVASKLVEIAHCPVLVARMKDYAAMASQPDPVCPDCARVRHATGGETMWCEYHSRPQIRPHAYHYSETFPVGGHDPGIIPSG